MHTFKKILLAAGCLVVGSLPSQASQAVAIFAMFEANTGKAHLHESVSGCTVARQGDIVKRQGNMELPDATRFALVSCDSEQLGQKGYADQLFAHADPVIMVEGGLKFLSENADAPGANKRSYIMKLSHYNNVDPKAREADFNALGKAVDGLADQYQAEAFVDVRRAVGMQTPDEVAAIYYDSPEAGNRFRENNGPILQKVGAFNKTHMDSFVYFYAKMD